MKLRLARKIMKYRVLWEDIVMFDASFPIRYSRSQLQEAKRRLNQAHISL